jgi:DNA polymerase-1
MITLIDISAEYWRNFHGTGSAVKGYDLTLERIDWYARENPQEVIVCCDHPVNKRKEIDPSYKAQRKPQPKDGVDSLIGCQERVISWGLPLVKVPGYEADDLIATLCEQAWPRDVQIIGSEKDFYCLISDTVTLIGRNGPIDIEACKRKFGVPPERMTDLLALVGDASDNVKGCEGIGILKAQAIIEHYATLADAVEAAKQDSLHIKGIGETLTKNLAAWDPESALRLVRLMRDAPISLETLLAPVDTEEAFPEEFIPF